MRKGKYKPHSDWSQRTFMIKDQVPGKRKLVGMQTFRQEDTACRRETIRWMYMTLYINRLENYAVARYLPVYRHYIDVMRPKRVGSKL